MQNIKADRISGVAAEVDPYDAFPLQRDSQMDYLGDFAGVVFAVDGEDEVGAQSVLGIIVGSDTIQDCGDVFAVSEGRGSAGCRSQLEIADAVGSEVV